MPTIIPVVEGDGDADAVPILLNRILSEHFRRTDVSVAYGKRSVVKANGRQKLETKLESLLKHARNKAECDAILILLDADNDCPVELAGRLWERCSRVGLSCPVQIVCASRSYETWFLASLDTIRGQGNLIQTASLAQEAEDVANPKRWLTDQMPPGRAYKETTHQAALSKLIDIESVHRNSRSFRRLCHAIELLLDGLGVPAA